MHQRLARNLQEVGKGFRFRFRHPAAYGRGIHEGNVEPYCTDANGFLHVLIQIEKRTRCATHLLRGLIFCSLFSLVPSVSIAQRSPFVPLGDRNAPRGFYFSFIDNQQRLWLAGRQAGEEHIYYFDGTRFVSPAVGRISMGTVTGMTEDSRGGIWFAASQGVYRLERGVFEKVVGGTAINGITAAGKDTFLLALPETESGAVHAVRIAKSAAGWMAARLFDLKFRVRFSVDRAGNVLYACGNAFCEVPADAISRWTPGTPLPMMRHRFEAADVSDTDSIVVRDSKGCIWKRALTGAAYQCPGDPRVVTLPANLANLGPQQIIELHDGAIAIPSADRLAIGRPGSFRVYTARNGYPGSRRVSAGSDDCLWIADERGLFMFPEHSGIEFWSAEEGVNGTAWSVVRKGTQVVLMGDEMLALSKDRSRWEPLNGPVGRLTPGPGTTVYVNTTHGIVQTDLNGKILRNSPAASVWFMAQSRDGTYWAGGDGLFKVNPRPQRLELQAIGAPKQYDNVQGLQADRSGNVWACGSFGLARLNARGEQTFHLAAGSLAHVCDALTMDEQENVWIADAGRPFLALVESPQTTASRLKGFSDGGDIGLAGAEFLGSDARGWLWRGAPNGLYVADVDEAKAGRWLHLGTFDGIPAGDANQSSFSLDADGSVWFGVENSIIHIAPPQDLVHPRVAPSVFVSTIAWDADAPRMADGAPRLKYGSDLTVGLGSLQFDRREAMRVEYRILPGQSDWRRVGGFDLRLGKLHWGKHSLQVRARLGDGLWSNIAEKQLDVSLPPWLAWQDLSGFLLVSISVIGAGMWWRQKRYAQKNFAAGALPSLAELRLAALSPELQGLGNSLLDERFLIGSVLARGGFATVFEGRDTRCEGRRCAIKVFRQEVLDQEWMIKRFAHEVAALEQIHHPHVVRILHSGNTQNGAFYLAMEFIEGETLRDALKNGPLPIQTAAALLRQAGMALGEIHRHGICHRDLKPENLMLRRTDSGEKQLVLIDFSIAIVKDPDETLHGLSRAAGTLYYMAPEQAIGYADVSSDIYSLAKVLIEMLTGKRLSVLLPDAAMDLPRQVKHLLCKLSVPLSPSSIDLLGAALEFDPLRRPRNARQFAAGIAADLEGYGAPEALRATAATDGDASASVHPE